MLLSTLYNCFKICQDPTLSQTSSEVLAWTKDYFYGKIQKSKQPVLKHNLLITLPFM